MEEIQSLPPLSSLSSSTVSFLNKEFHRKEDLIHATSLVSQLQKQCVDLDQNLIDLNRTLESTLLAYSFHSNKLHDLFRDINLKLTRLSSSTCSSSDGAGGEARAEQELAEELPALAKEVARVETVRMYAETALKLDSLVGSVEDAVSSTMSRNLKKHASAQSSEEMRLHALKTLKLIEDVLTAVTKTRPQWARLVSAVDHRIDRALAILRPQAIADHRVLLASLGWPPPLSTLNSSNLDMRKSSEVLNPLFTMQGDLKHQYCENFLALCGLQELQRRRKYRQLEGYDREIALHQPLWVIEELVTPMSLAFQRHFSRWVDNPEFIFALVYKVTRDYVDSMDELLQPLVDEALLGGYSCREEWISAMVTSLTVYLEKEIFPCYVGQLDEECVIDIQSKARIAWLHLIDLMITFDKRVQSMLQSELLLSLQEDGNLQKISSLSVFCDRHDWLDLWAKVELGDMLDKLKLEIEDGKNWTMKVQGAVLLPVPEDYRSPAISSSFLQRLSAVVERCRSLPSVSLSSRFARLTGVPIIQKFLDCLLLKCQEAEGLTALTDDDALIKVTNSINAAHYFESVLKEWCEDVFFLEMGLHRDDQLSTMVDVNSFSGGPIEGPGSSIFDEEIGKLEKFRLEWVGKISIVLSRGFDARCRDYVKNRKQWQEKGEEGWTVSKSFVGALDYLQGKISILEGSLNRIDFVGVWTSLAANVDRLIFNGILMSNVKFYDAGVERFSCDFEVLLGVFRAWCLRPEGFLPKGSDGLKLLKMGEDQLQDYLAEEEKWMMENGIRHLSAAEAEKIVKNRIFTS